MTLMGVMTSLLRLMYMASKQSLRKDVSFSYVKMIAVFKWTEIWNLCANLVTTIINWGEICMK